MGGNNPTFKNVIKITFLVHHYDRGFYKGLILNLENKYFIIQ